MNLRKTYRISLIHAAIAAMLSLLVLVSSGCEPGSHTGSVSEKADISLNTDTVEQESFGKYNRNYLDFSVDEIEYEGYCINGDEQNDGLFNLYTQEDAASKEILDGSFCNVTPITGIQKITVNYKSDSDMELTYGNDCKSLDHAYMLPAQEEYGEQTVTLDESASFFRLSDTLGDVHVAGLDIYCKGESSDETAQYDLEGVRYIPETDYDPYEGESLELPVVKEDSAGNYYISEWKSYTYHSWEYCRDKIVNEGENPANYALTDPGDVANYFVLFNRIPANYGIKEGNEENWTQVTVQEDVPSSAEVLEIFGSDLARCVQQFQRTDGYCTNIDYSLYENTGLPLYYEFDFDTDGTYDFTNRGVGRVVGYVGGFACYDDNVNTAVITTDHYYTFAESTNCGFFNPHFDVYSPCKSGNTFQPSELLNEEDLTMQKAS